MKAIRLRKVDLPSMNEDNEQSPESASSPQEVLSEEIGEEVEAEADDDMNDLDRAVSERDAYLDDLKRLKAEFENYRKRILKEQTEVVERASSNVISGLLPVLDNFELAIAAAEETSDFERMLRGIEMVYGELKEVLGSEGLRPINAKGKPFDPNFHEAAIELPSAEEDPEGNETELVVAEVLRPGYTFKDRVLRPAMVKVRREGKK